MINFDLPIHSFNEINIKEANLLRNFSTSLALLIL